MNVNIPPTPPHPTHLYATPIFNATTSSYDAMQWTPTSPPPPPICMQERQNMHISSYIYQRETEGSYVFRGTPSLSPIYIIYIYMIYIYIISAVIYGFFRPSVLDLAGSRFRRTEGTEGTEGTWVSGRQGTTRHIPPEHQTSPFLGFNLGTRCWPDWPGSREHDLVSTLETKLEIPTV